MKGLDAKETHFRLFVVSDAFEKQSLLQRHRTIYDVLGQELKDGLHALSMTLKTPAEVNK